MSVLGNVMEWKDWSNILFSEREHLPSCSGIYAIADANNCLWYVGHAVDLKTRWTVKRYHRYSQLICSTEKRYYRIYWKPVQAHYLYEQKHHYVNLFQLELNGCKVRKYLPKQSQMQREIRRLLKALNNTSVLFPVIHSVIAGEYEDDNGIRCIIAVVQIDDFRIIDGSIRKQGSPEIRKAWMEYKTRCGRDERQYSEIYLPAYSFGNYRFEFIEVSELLQFLEDASGAYDRYVGVTNLMGVQVKVLKDLSVLDRISIAEEYCFTDFDGKKHLTDAAYLNYRKPILKCLMDGNAESNDLSN